MNANEIYTKIFQLNGIDDNNRYTELTGDQISTVQLVEPAVSVSAFILNSRDEKSLNNHIDKVAHRIPVVAIDDHLINQADISGFKLDYTGFVPTVMVDFVDTTNAMLSTNVVKDGSIVKVFIGGQGDELYYKPIRQDFLITNVKKIDGCDQKYGDYLKYRVYGKLNIPYGYKKEAWTCGPASARQELFNLAIYTGLGFATNFANLDTPDTMNWVNNECETYFDFMEEVSRHACYSPNTFFTSFIDQFNVLNFIECHSLLSHGGKKTDIPAMIYSNIPDPEYPDGEGDETNKKIKVHKGYDDMDNTTQKLSYYYISNNDFFDGWTNFIDEYTEINNGYSSISDGYNKHVVYSDSNASDWGFTECEFVIPPIDNLKRDYDTQKIESLPDEVDQKSYIPLNLAQMTKSNYTSDDGSSIDNTSSTSSYMSYGEVDTSNMFKQYFFAEAQNLYQMKCLKKCGLKVVLQNYNPAITKFSRIWVDIYDKNLISNTQLIKEEITSKDDGNWTEYKSIKNDNILKFDDEGVMEIVDNPDMKNKNWPRGEFNRALSGWYVVTEMEIIYDADIKNIKMKLTLNRIEYQPCFVSDYKTAKQAVDKYKEENIIDNIIIKKDDFSYSV